MSAPQTWGFVVRWHDDTTHRDTYRHGYASQSDAAWALHEQMGLIDAQDGFIMEAWTGVCAPDAPYGVSVGVE